MEECFSLAGMQARPEMQPRRAIAVGAMISLALAIALSNGGCKHQAAGGPIAGADLSRFKIYYVVTDKKDNPVARALEQDLGSRGPMVTTGLDWAMPADAQVIVRFRDVWQVDITRYLQEVKIEMADAQTGTLLAWG